MKREIKKYLYDIKHAADLLDEFTVGKTFGEYESDAMLRAAVEREFEIIGEAVNRIASMDASVANRISQYQRIIAFRNILIHGYADVDDRLVWGVIEANIPALIKDIDLILQED